MSAFCEAKDGGFRVFSPAGAKGGAAIEAAKTAVLFIEYQHEFTTEKGKLHDAVKGVMAETDMLKKSVAVAEAARGAGAKVFHVGIQFKKDASDNPNGGLGILAGCKGGELFTEGTWNAEFCDEMKPQAGDTVIQGKRGLNAFPGTDLEAKLREHGVEHVALGGFLTNCCVESTMRTAYEKGFNVITLTDCCACTSAEGQAAAAGKDGTFGMFSAQMTGAEFMAGLRGDHRLPKDDGFRVFSPADAKGGAAVAAAKTAVVFIEYQHEFTTEKGKLHDAVKGVMAETDMLKKSVAVAEAARGAGAKVFHVGIKFKKDASDNPNGGLGILAGCKGGELFTEGTWNAEFCDEMKPQAGDTVIQGKRGLDAFPGTDLEAKLREHGVEHVALGGFLTNCCVESTMRTAYEMGYNVITLTDCCACTSAEGQAAAAGKDGTFGMFSAQMTGAEFMATLAGSK